MNLSIVIPARYGSSRFKGKPLAKILNREMILRVADICSKVVSKKNLFIATDSTKIANVVKKAQYQVIMTSSKCLTGTDRIAEASKKIKSKFIINVQGDEPTINPEDIKKIISAKLRYPNYIICGYDNISKNENPSNLNLPKVLINNKKELVYISRSLIPGTKNKRISKKLNYHKQVCIYGFNKSQLNKFHSQKKKGEIEKIEDIEILRFFDLNIKIKMIKLSSNSIAVDEPKDLRKAENLLIKRYKSKQKKHRNNNSF